jgi:raffinose/stachyose/melibiose transport system substrate-binding protein
MTTPTNFSRRSVLGLAGLGAGAVLLGGCGDDGSGDSGNGGGSASIDWWHISNVDPMLTIFANQAKEFQAANAGVEFKITPLENEAFKAKLTTVTQAGTPPDIFHSWGGGVLKQQVDAGLVKEVDLGDAAANINSHGLDIYKVGGKQYGVPFDLGMVGFWYNRELFEKAKIAAPPTTWGEFLDAVRKLKGAGVTPIALAGSESWTAHFYWAYLAIRIAGVDGLAAAADSGAFDQPDFVAAGARFKELIDLDPFQKGFLGAKYSATDGQAALMGNGQAAIELMGQWAPTTEKAYSTNKQGIGDKLGYFQFPAVDGGKGSIDDAFGGANGMALGKDAPPQALEFLKFLLNADQQRKGAETDSLLPVTKGAEDALKDTNLKAMHATIAKAPKYQLYLDQAYPPAVGTQVNDSVAELVAKKATPEKVAQDIAKVAKNQ